MARMNPKIKKLWVKELRSGDFEQGQEVLRRGQKCCCLGVLCELAYEHGVPMAIKRYAGGEYTYDGHAGNLPYFVMKWAGLSQANPEVVLNSQRRTLSSCNDHLSLTFEEIADLIEAQL